MIVKYDDKEKAVYLDEPLTKEIVRTIKYEPPIKCKLPIVQKAVFHRTATVDDETYGVEEYSEWEAENNTWDKVEIDEEEGKRNHRCLPKELKKMKKLKTLKNLKKKTNL